MPEREGAFNNGEEVVPSEEHVAELRRMLENAEKAKRGAGEAPQQGKPTTDKDRQDWMDELDAMRAASRARSEDRLELRGGGRKEPGFIPPPGMKGAGEKKRIAVDLDEQEKE